MSNDTILTPADAKRQGIIEAATASFRRLLGEHIDAAAIDATESFQEDENATEPSVKLAFTVSFAPMQESPDVCVRVAWSVRRVDEETTTVDTEQTKFDLSGKGGAE